MTEKQTDNNVTGKRGVFFTNTRGLRCKCKKNTNSKSTFYQRFVRQHLRKLWCCECPPFTRLVPV